MVTIFYEHSLKGGSMRFLKLILPIAIAFLFIADPEALANHTTKLDNSDSILSSGTDPAITDPSQPNKMLIPIINEDHLNPVDKISEPKYADDKLVPGLPVYVTVEVIKRSQQSLDDSTIALTPESKSKIEKPVENLYYRAQKNDAQADSLGTNTDLQRGEIRFRDIERNRSYKCADVLMTGYPRNIMIMKVPNKGCQLFSHEFYVKNDDGSWNTKLEVYLEIDEDPS